MRENYDINGQKYFSIIMDSLKNEDKILKKSFSNFRYNPSDYTGKGINDLYEHHIQYLLFRNFLERGSLFVYMEDPYTKVEGRCDLTLYDLDRQRNLWIEIKVTGWCQDWQYKRWIKGDAEKLRKFHKRGARKYLLVTSVEDEKPEENEWDMWFKNNLSEVKFNPKLFGYFLTIFSDGKKFQEGFYTVCLLQVF